LKDDLHELKNFSHPVEARTLDHCMSCFCILFAYTAQKIETFSIADICRSHTDPELVLGTAFQAVLLMFSQSIMQPPLLHCLRLLESQSSRASFLPCVYSPLRTYLGFLIEIKQHTDNEIIHWQRQVVRLIVIRRIDILG